jgi:hypothetical protein
LREGCIKKAARFLLTLYGPKYYAVKFFRNLYCPESPGKEEAMKIRFKSLFFCFIFTFVLIGIVECRSFPQKKGLTTAEEKKVVISVEEFGKKFGVPEEEIVIPNGEKRLHQKWQNKDIQRAISELQSCFNSPETTYLLTEISEPWITLALMEALKPLHIKYLYPRSNGTELEMYELKKGKQSPNYDVVFEVVEADDKIFINLNSDSPDALTIGHHTFNLDNLSKVVIPEIPSGKHVFIHGKGMYSVMVCIAKNYIKGARSLSMASHDSDYICAVSFTDDLEVGDVTPRTLKNNL